jgi:excisionase family DNA binding protein
MPREREFLSPRQIARATGLSESSIKRWCDTGRIPATRTAGGHRRIALEDVQQYLRDAGHEPVSDSLLTAPAPSGVTHRTLARAADAFHDAIGTSADAAAAIALELHQAGQPWSVILDEVILPVISPAGVGSSRQPEEWRSRFIRRNIQQVIAQLLECVEPGVPDAPLAIAAALDGAPDAIEVLAAELTLAGAGWRVDRLGTLLPFVALQEAVERNAPRLMFLDVPLIRRQSGFLNAWASLRAAAARHGTFIALGGAGLERDIVETMQPDAWCPDARSLEQMARKCFRPADQTT